MLVFVRESVECADNVVSVEAEVEREMIPRPRGYLDVGDVVFHRDLGDNLWAVAAAIPITVAEGAASRASACRSSPGSSTMGSMPRRRASLNQVEPLNLAAARPRVHRQHTLTGRCRTSEPRRRRRDARPLERDSPAERESGRGAEDGERDNKRDQFVDGASPNKLDPCAAERCDHDRHRKQSCDAASGEGKPAGRADNR
jgi:hypothetical protein